MNDRDIEHSEITMAERTGYGPSFVPSELNLQEFAEENAREFIAWEVASDPDTLVKFAEEHPWLWEG